MDIWKRDLIREMMMKQKGLNQMRRLSYDKKYQNGHATSLEPLNKGWMSKQSIVKCLGNLR